MKHLQSRHQSLLLVTPPFVRPTSPPLGIASLKAFLKQEIPAVQVRCLDLNLEYYHLALKWLEAGTIKLKLYDWDHEKTVRMLKKAFDFLRSVRPDDENIKEYHRKATIFLSFENIFNAFVSEMAIRSLAGAPIPSGISAFLERLMMPVVNCREDLVGCSVLFDLQMPMALLMAKRIKEKTNKQFVVGGARFGVDPSFERLFLEPVVKKIKGKEYIQHTGDFLDGIIPGEGEMALLALIKNSSPESYAEIPNLVYRKGEKIFHNEPAVLNDLDMLPPPDFSDFPLGEYICAETVLPLLAARGCPWGKCTFCTHHHSYKRYRQRSIQKVVEDIKYLSGQFNARLFNFFDEMIPPGRFKKMAEEILRSNIHICYSAYGKPVKSFDRKTLKLLSKSGCSLMLWGVESASQRVLALMKKGTEVEEMEKVLNHALEAGICNLLFIMFGFPGETEQEFFQTFSFLERNRRAVQALSKGTFRLMEGSEIAREPDRFDIEKVIVLNSPPFKSRILAYEPRKGLSPFRVEQLFQSNLNRLESLGITPRFGAYREHLLVYACNKRKNGLG